MVSEQQMIKTKGYHFIWAFQFTKQPLREHLGVLFEEIVAANQSVNCNNFADQKRNKRENDPDHFILAPNDSALEGFEIEENQLIFVEQNNVRPY